MVGGDMPLPTLPADNIVPCSVELDQEERLPTKAADELWWFQEEIGFPQQFDLSLNQTNLDKSWVGHS